jgi:predicted transcriptional regulator
MVLFDTNYSLFRIDNLIITDQATHNSNQSILYLYHMNRIDRLAAILIHLQTKRIVKAEEIADRFEISLRTVYRDVKALMEAGVPIGSEAGT